MLPLRSEFEQSLVLLNKRAAILHLALAGSILAITIWKWRDTIKVKFATNRYIKLVTGSNQSAFGNFLNAQKDNAVEEKSEFWTALNIDERSNLVPQFYMSQKTAYSARLGMLVFAFAIITAAFHWYIYKHPEPYLHNVFDNSIQPLRWIEYSITSTIMLVCIGSLSDIQDAGTLWLLVGVSVAMILSGYSIETSPGVADGLSNLKLAWFAVGMGYFVIIWAIILQRFTQSANFVSKNGSKLPAYLTPLVKFPNDKLKIPSFVYFIVYGLAFQYLLFPVVMAIGQNAFNWSARQHAASASKVINEYGGYEKYAYGVGEWGFVILSFVAKGYLVGNVGYGAIREDPDVYVGS